MNLIQAIILGIVQGATEFLPVSSSGHLVLAPWWLGWGEVNSLTFTVAAHLGTLCAVLVYFRQDWLAILRGGLALLRTRSLADPYGRLFLYLIIGSIPAGLAGLLFAAALEQAFANAAAAAAFLLVTAALLILSERWAARRPATRALDTFRWADALFVGLAQMLALLPGISRSGSTIAAGLFRGVSRTDAARFSFLLSTPAILGAGLLAAVDLLAAQTTGGELLLLVAGFVSAGLVGYLAIAFLLAHLRQHRLYLFAAYCVVVGLVSLLAALAGR